MNVITFISELLNGLSSFETVPSVTSQAEGPTIRGRAQFEKDLFLSFYYNQVTGTQAFALVQGEKRIWGIDYDKVRGWHEHPMGQPDLHVNVEAQTIESVIQHLKEAVAGATPAGE